MSTMPTSTDSRPSTRVRSQSHQVTTSSIRAFTNVENLPGGLQQDKANQSQEYYLKHVLKAIIKNGIEKKDQMETSHRAMRQYMEVSQFEMNENLEVFKAEFKRDVIQIANWYSDAQIWRIQEELRTSRESQKAALKFYFYCSLMILVAAMMVSFALLKTHPMAQQALQATSASVQDPLAFIPADKVTYIKQIGNSLSLKALRALTWKI